MNDYDYEPAEDREFERVGLCDGWVVWLRHDESKPDDWEPLYRRVPAVPSQREGRRAAMSAPEYRETVEQMCARTIKRRSEAIADRLRSAADRIVREANMVDRVGQPGVPSYARVVSSVQNEIRNLFGNLQFDGITTDAGDADQARQRRLTAETIAVLIEAKAEATRGDSYTTSTGVALAGVLAEGARIAREYAAEEG